MKNWIIFWNLTLLFGLAISANGQNRITVNLEAFDALSVSGRIDVELVLSDTHEMSITTLKGAPEDVKYEIKDGELKIKSTPDLSKENEISIKLPVAGLSRIEASAGAVINSKDELTAETLDLKANTGGKIELSVEVGSLDVKITQVSDIILYGKAVSQRVVANTGGNYLAYDLICDDSYVKSSSGSQIKVTANRIIEANSNTKGFVGYIGDPVSTYTKTSLGGVIASYKEKSETEGF